MKKAMEGETLVCPACRSEKVATTDVQLFMVNTGEHYCHSVKAHDGNSRAVCLVCEWEGRRVNLTAL